MTINPDIELEASDGKLELHAETTITASDPTTMLDATLAISDTEGVSTEVKPNTEFAICGFAMVGIGMEASEYVE